jgi:hypothetical protein
VDFYRLSFDFGKPGTASVLSPRRFQKGSAVAGAAIQRRERLFNRDR